MKSVQGKLNAKWGAQCRLLIKYCLWILNSMLAWLLSTVESLFYISSSIQECLGCMNGLLCDTGVHLQEALEEM